MIQFRTEHTTGRLPASILELLPKLLGWRRVLYRLGLVGQDPSRYDGLGFGNVSVRVPPYPGERGARAFVVSASQTGGAPEPSGEQWAVVSAYGLDDNHVVSRGPMPPSSESLTHAALYDLSPNIRCVLHVHCPEIWECAATLRLPITPSDIRYGTVAMARAVTRLYHDTNLAERRVLAMAGHHDGVIAFGRSPEEAGTALVSVLALSQACRNSLLATT